MSKVCELKIMSVCIFTISFTRLFTHWQSLKLKIVQKPFLGFRYCSQQARIGERLAVQCLTTVIIITPKRNLRDTGFLGRTSLNHFLTGHKFVPKLCLIEVIWKKKLKIKYLHLGYEIKFVSFLRLKSIFYGIILRNSAHTEICMLLPPPVDQNVYAYCANFKFSKVDD